ncbi:MAG: hypothetical protein PHE54_04105 [Bacilli bacterium]|nr:hypothetical protein [Bacilli bacterium]
MKQTNSKSILQTKEYLINSLHQTKHFLNAEMSKFNICENRLKAVEIQKNYFEAKKSHLKRMLEKNKKHYINKTKKELLIDICLVVVFWLLVYVINVVTFNTLLIVQRYFIQLNLVMLPSVIGCTLIKYFTIYKMENHSLKKQIKKAKTENPGFLTNEIDYLKQKEASKQKIEELQKIISSIEKSLEIISEHGSNSASSVNLVSTEEIKQIVQGEAEADKKRRFTRM